jgi:hypothetical protein
MEYLQIDPNFRMNLAIAINALTGECPHVSSESKGVEHVHYLSTWRTVRGSIENQITRTKIENGVIGIRLSYHGTGLAEDRQTGAKREIVQPALESHLNDVNASLNAIGLPSIEMADRGYGYQMNCNYTAEEAATVAKVTYHVYMFLLNAGHVELLNEMAAIAEAELV